MAIAPAVLTAPAAAFARHALLQRPPHGEREERDDDRQNKYRRCVHRTSLRAGRNTAHRHSASTTSVTTVQNPKPQPQATRPIW